MPASAIMAGLLMSLLNSLILKSYLAARRPAFPACALIPMRSRGAGNEHSQNCKGLCRAVGPVIGGGCAAPADKILCLTGLDNDERLLANHSLVEAR